MNTKNSPFTSHDLDPEEATDYQIALRRKNDPHRELISLDEAKKTIAPLNPYADLTITNLFKNEKITIHALVDTRATFMCVTEEMATQLGFDTEEVSTHVVTLADGRQIKAPRIAPIEIAFANRTYVTEALVLGNEALMGVLPLQAMDLMVDPLNQQIVVNPAHPNFPVALAK
jgi:clan AA aspartic protease